MSVIYIDPYSFSGSVTNGLVMHLDAGNSTSYPGSGTTWTDLSGNANTGTLVGGVGYNSSNGGFLTFDGSNDAVTTLGRFATGAAAKSFSVWFKINSTTSRGWVVAGGSDNNGQAFGLFREGPPNNRLIFHGNGPGDLVFVVSQNATDFYNAAVTYDGTTVRAYINGQLDASGARTLNTGNTTVVLGRRQLGTDFFNGNIAQALMYNRALSATEVTQNFNALRGRFGL